MVDVALWSRPHEPAWLPHGVCRPLCMNYVGEVDQFTQSNTPGLLSLNSEGNSCLPVGWAFVSEVEWTEGQGTTVAPGCALDDDVPVHTGSATLRLYIQHHNRLSCHAHLPSCLPACLPALFCSLQVTWHPTQPSLLASSSLDGTVVAFQADGSQVKLLTHTSPTSGCAWANQGYQLATTSDSGAVHV